MPVNRNALIRFRTIDRCLQNRYRKWTLENLIDACSDALYEYEGIEKGVSKRTVQLDIQMMRSDKLGYNAPIVVMDRKYYTYEDPEYSIASLPLTETDLNTLDEVVDILSQFKGFSHFSEVGGMIKKLEHKILTEKNQRQPIIDFEKNENLKGLEYLDVLYQSILKKHPVEITYRSFKAKDATVFRFHPWFLKEYNNRWFLLGVKKSDVPVQTLALDRIDGLQQLPEEAYLYNEGLRLEDHYEHVVGVTVMNVEPEEIDLFFRPFSAPYVLTKPIHPSQTLIEQTKAGAHIRLKVQINYEFEREIISFGEGVRVIGPPHLKETILKRLSNTLANYDLPQAE